MGMSRGFSWPMVGRLAALTAVYAIEHPGTQEHSYSLDEFLARYEQNYGDSDGESRRRSMAAAWREPAPMPVASRRSGRRPRGPRTHSASRIHAALPPGSRSDLPPSRPGGAGGAAGDRRRPLGRAAHGRLSPRGSSPGTSPAGRSSGGRRTLGWSCSPTSSGSRRRLARTIRQGRFETRYNTAFAQVIRACAETPRAARGRDLDHPGDAAGLHPPARARPRPLHGELARRASWWAGSTASASAAASAASRCSTTRPTPPRSPSRPWSSG